MPGTSRSDRSEQMPAAVSDTSYAAYRPWSYRVAGAKSSWPAVELYEAGSLLDVVTSTRLTARVLRGARAVRDAGGERVLAWGRLPLGGGLVTVEFGRGAFRGSRLAVRPVSVTSWCWLAVADERYDEVIVRYGGTAMRRLAVSRASC